MNGPYGNLLRFLFGISLPTVFCDYACLCNFDIPLLSILPYIGYIQNNEYIRRMNCSGSPPVDETVHITSPSTTIGNSAEWTTTEITSAKLTRESSTSTFTRTTHFTTVTTPSIHRGHIELCPSHVKTDANLKGGFVGQFGQFCYEYVNWKRAFDGAESHCKVEAGTLLSISNQQEQDFIDYFLANHKITEKTWIGLNDKQVEGTLTWTSGVPVTYTNFQAGFNQHSTLTHKNNDCFVIQNGGDWVDQPCGVAISVLNFGESHPFICQYNISAKIGTFSDILPNAISVG